MKYGGKYKFRGFRKNRNINSSMPKMLERYTKSII